MSLVQLESEALEIPTALEDMNGDKVAIAAARAVADAIDAQNSVTELAA